MYLGATITGIYQSKYLEKEIERIALQNETN